MVLEGPTVCFWCLLQMMFGIDKPRCQHALKLVACIARNLFGSFNNGWVLAWKWTQRKLSYRVGPFSSARYAKPAICAEIFSTSWKKTAHTISRAGKRIIGLPIPHLCSKYQTDWKLFPHVCRFHLNGSFQLVEPFQARRTLPRSRVSLQQCMTACGRLRHTRLGFNPKEQTLFTHWYRVNMRRYDTHLIRQLVVQSKLTHSASSMIQLSRLIARGDQMPDLSPIKMFANWPSLFDPSPAFGRCGLPFVHNKSHTRNNVFPLAQSDS